MVRVGVFLSPLCHQASSMVISRVDYTTKVFYIHPCHLSSYMVVVKVVYITKVSS